MRERAPAVGARFLLIGSAVLLMLSGCATLTVVSAERLEAQRLTPAAEPVAHIYAANWGVYLFKYIPIVTGSLERPGVPRWPALFSDQVQIDALVQMVSEESKRRGGTVLTDLRTRDRSYWMGQSLIFWLVERVRSLGELFQVAMTGNDARRSPTASYPAAPTSTSSNGGVSDRVVGDSASAFRITGTGSYTAGQRSRGVPFGRRAADDGPSPRRAE